MMPVVEFIEKQYFGLNKISLTRRMSLAILSFSIYYLRENQEKSGDLYFFLGIIIIFISIVLFFILHFKTQIINNALILDGLWTSRKVKIDIKSIVKVEKVKYSKYIWNRAVYNLHFKGIIKFYTRGDDAVKLTDRDGLVYLIGTQKLEELYRVIKHNLK